MTIYIHTDSREHIFVQTLCMIHDWKPVMFYENSSEKNIKYLIKLLKVMFN